MLCEGKHGYRERKRDDHIDQIVERQRAKQCASEERRRGAAIHHRATIQLVCSDGMQLRTPVGASTGLISASSSLGSAAGKTPGMAAALPTAGSI